MIFGIPKEISSGEKRVALSPEGVNRLVNKKNFQVFMEADAGKLAGFSDEEYKNVGASIKQTAEEVFSKADVVLKVQKPEKTSSGKNEIELMKVNSFLISFFYALTSPALVKLAQKNSVNVISMDAIPRISRAQRMDALSSQTNLAGYKAVLIAANNLSKIFPMLMTAAGTITPAKVVILGAGVAGLQAIATAKRLGATVHVSDVRPAVKEQVESLGASYIEPPQEENVGEEGGYAKEASKEFLEKQKELLEKYISQADAVITTALVPGKKAPILISRSVVEKMQLGSVIVDMASEQGGNCELTQANRTIEHQGVKIIGTVNLPSTVAFHASQLYSRNLIALLDELTKKENTLNIDLEDEIIQGSLIVYQGEVIHSKTKEVLGL